MKKTVARVALAVALSVMLGAAAEAAPLFPARSTQAQKTSSFAYKDRIPSIVEVVRPARPARTAAVRRPTRRLVSMRVMATAYALRGRTAGGTYTARGTIAVDPRLIPLGTRIYVPGYGWGRALDTGGAVRGNVIDIWLPSVRDCYAWGVRTVQILVERPEPKRPRQLASRRGKGLKRR